MYRSVLLGELASDIQPLRFQDPDNVRIVIKELKQDGGEGWACGETLERIINFLGNLTEEQLAELDEIAKKHLKGA